MELCIVFPGKKVYIYIYELATANNGGAFVCFARISWKDKLFLINVNDMLMTFCFYHQRPPPKNSVTHQIISAKSHKWIMFLRVCRWLIFSGYITSEAVVLAFSCWHTYFSSNISCLSTPTVLAVTCVWLA